MKILNHYKAYKNPRQLKLLISHYILAIICTNFSVWLYFVYITSLYTQVYFQKQ